MQRIGAVQSATASGTYCTITAYPSSLAGAANGLPFESPNLFASTTINMAISSGGTATLQPVTLTPQGTQVAYGAALTASTFLSINSPIAGAAVQVNAVTGSVLIEIESAVI